MQGLSDSSYTDALDRLGYTKELSEKRVKLYDNFAESITMLYNRNWSEKTYTIIPGSRGEGLTGASYSDIDMLIVQPAIKCFETYPTTESEEVKNYDATFQLDFENVPKGYTKLRLKHIKENLKGSKHNTAQRIKQSLDEHGHLRSGLRLIDAVEYEGKGQKVMGWLTANCQYDEINGPAQTLKFPLPFLGKYVSLDYVQAFPCSFPSLFDEWGKRERKHEWPSTDVLNAVTETDVFVVSVGHSDSEEKSLQWRISSTPAEILLVRTFNDSQIKLYAAMKMLVKEELKPLCSNITSYIVKNVIFWVFEKQSGVFQADAFVDILMKALKYLKECVTLGCLPSYFISSKNLLQGKISEEETRDLIAHLDVLITEGSSCLRRCPLINNMLDKSQDGLREDGLLFRKLVDQIILTFASLRPTVFCEIEHEFHMAQTPEELLPIYFRRVLPVVKESNPFEYFGLLRTLSDIDIIRLIITGFGQHYDVGWLDK